VASTLKVQASQMKDDSAGLMYRVREMSRVHCGWPLPCQLLSGERKVLYHHHCRRILVSLRVESYALAVLRPYLQQEKDIEKVFTILYMFSLSHRPIKSHEN
jgi:hypothetical protein